MPRVKQEDHRPFVNALRAYLDLEPLYGPTRDPRTKFFQRFTSVSSGRRVPVGSIRNVGIGSRRAELKCWRGTYE